MRKSRLAASLTHRSFLTIRDSVIKPLSAQQASSSKDALVKVAQPTCRVGRLSYSSNKPQVTAYIQIILVLDVSGDLQQAVCLDCGENQQRHLRTFDGRRQIALLVHQPSGYLWL